MIRATLSSFARRLCEAVAERIPEPRRIYDREGESLYLTRYYLLGRPMTSFDENGNPVGGDTQRRFPIDLFLHCFHRGDSDDALHNHPWRWAVSLILAGGYSEERRVGNELEYVARPLGGIDHPFGYRVVRRDVLPFTVNLIRGNDFHRVDLLEKDAWSLFLVGPRAQTWGFWDRWTGEYLHWRDFITKVRGVGWEKNQRGEA